MTPTPTNPAAPAPTPGSPADPAAAPFWNDAVALLGQQLVAVTGIAGYAQAANHLLAQIAAGVVKPGQIAAASAKLTGPSPGAGPAGTPTPSPLGGSNQTAGLIDKATSLFFSKLTLVLAPLTAFATILNQSASGFKVFLSAVNLVGATLAPILLPVFVLLAAALNAASDVIWSQLEPALQRFYTLVIGSVIGALETFVTWIGKAWRAIQEFVAALPVKEAEEARRTGSDALARGIAGVGEFLGVVPEGTGNAIAQDMIAGHKQRRAAAANPPAGGENAPAAGPGVGPFGDFGAGGKGLKGFFDSLKDTRAELQFQAGPKASLGGLVQASRSAQLAAFNESPFEQKMLARMQGALDRLDKVIANLDKPEPRFK